MGKVVSYVPLHDAMSTPQHVSSQHHVSLPQHEAMSAPSHIDQLVPKHAMQLTKTSVHEAETVSRRIDPEQTELEEDPIPGRATSGAQRGARIQLT